MTWSALPAPREPGSWALVLLATARPDAWREAVVRELRVLGVQPPPSSIGTTPLEGMGHRLVVIVTPHPGGGDTAPIDADVSRLRAGGSHVDVIAIDAGASSSSSSMDGSARTVASCVGTCVGALPAIVPAVDTDDLATRFAALRLHRAEWTHVAHLAVGLWHVHRFGGDDALARLRPGIRRLNESLGGANTETGGYHETITAAYVRVFELFLAAGGPVPVRRQVERFLASALADRGLLLRCYSKERLMSTQARAAFLEPDRAPLTLETLLAGDGVAAREAHHGA